MARNPSSDPRWRQQMSELRDRLVEAEDTLSAIRSGTVDALVVRTPRGEQLFTLKGADQTYRALVEAMNEGAVTLKNGIISYCNSHFAKMVRMPMEKVFGSPLSDLVQSEHFQRLLNRVQKGLQARASAEATLRAADGAEVPVLLSAARFYSEGQAAIGIVATDITDRKEVEQARLELSRRIINAQEHERQRVARDLHDGVTQLLASAKFRLNSIVAQDCCGGVSEARDLIEKAIAEVRLISGNLRPSELDDLGLVAALRSLAHDFQKRCGIPARFKSEITVHRSATGGEIEMALYRIAQEALNNVEKHSRATRADMVLARTRSHVLLAIRDNGRGFLPRGDREQKPGWGLENMNERAQLLGGRVVVSSKVKKGTHISVRLPFRNHVRTKSSKEARARPQSKIALGG